MSVETEETGRRGPLDKAAHNSQIHHFIMIGPHRGVNRLHVFSLKERGALWETAPIRPSPVPNTPLEGCL
jgi:hypothetical protein